MGSAESSVHSGEPPRLDSSTEGFYVLKVEEKSPGQKAGLEAYFDFIVSVNEAQFVGQDSTAFTRMLEANVHDEVRIYVYSLRTQEIRLLKAIPDDKWGGRGLLGIGIRHCTFSELEQNVWHVQEVIPGSPAALAGLESENDYIVGTDVIIANPADIFAYIESNNLNMIRLFVFNHVRDETRMVLLTPNSDWGGPGCIGCQLSYGYLHTIPKRSRPDSGEKPEISEVAADGEIGDINEIDEENTMKFSSVFEEKPAECSHCLGDQSKTTQVEPRRNYLMDNNLTFFSYSPTKTHPNSAEPTVSDTPTPEITEPKVDFPETAAIAEPNDVFPGKPSLPIGYQLSSRSPQQSAPAIFNPQQFYDPSKHRQSE